MIPNELIDYEKIRKSAAVRCGKRHIPKGEWDDIAGDAFLLAIRRAFVAHAEENVKAVAAKVMETAISDTLRKRRSAAPTISLDAIKTVIPDRDETNEDDDLVERGGIIGDRGRSAVRIRRASGADEVPRSDAVPRWLRLFNAERQKLRDEGKRTELRVLRALLKDSRFPEARSAAKVSRPTFSRILKFFRVRFALVYKELLQYRGLK